jgi:SPP1 family predicted phage head-tail adaptor
MNVGEFNARLSLLAPVKVPDKVGQKHTSYVFVRKAWGRVKALKGGELIQAQTIHEQISLEITVQRGHGIEADWQLIHGPRTYEVVAVLDNDDTSLFIRLMCLETKGA